jgi:hypothetical protein
MTTTTLTRRLTLHERLASCIPGATFELEAFLRLVEIRETTEIPTAAVTTGATCRLLINPEFVDRYCQHDEHLFLLVMHELWHVLFAHTRLTTRPTTAENIAFDAIINAGLTRQFPGVQYRGFFEAINSSKAFPNRLLRAPEGWPNNPNYSGDGPRGTRQILERLYPKPNVRDAAPTYGELVRLIERGTRRKEIELSSEASDSSGPVVVLGDHENDSGSSDPLSNPLLRSVLRDVTKSWPSPPASLGNDRMMGDLASPWIIQPAKPHLATEQIMELVLRRACRPARRGDPQRERVVRYRDVQTVIPVARDRQRVARRRLGVESLLWNGEVEEIRVANGRPGTALVYLDVSGSMSSDLPRLILPLQKFVERGLATTWQFSTTIEQLSLEELRSGSVTTTGGTAVQTVLEHALDQPTVSSIVIVSDGYVETVDESIKDRLAERGITVESVVCASGSLRPLDQLGPVTKLVG